MRRRWAAALFAAVAVTALAVPATAAAHGLVGRADLPIPYWLFGWAAAVVLIVSFAALAMLWQTPKLEPDDGFRPLPEGLSFALVNPATEVVRRARRRRAAGSHDLGRPRRRAGAAGELHAHVRLRDLLGRAGPAQHPLRGRVPRAQPVAGDRARRRLHRIAGLRADARAVHLSGVARALARGRGAARLRLDRALLSQRRAIPSALAIAALVYSAVTLLAIACFGTETWISRGEAFSVYYNLFSRISPVVVKEGRLGLRKPLSGVAQLDPAARARSRCWS